MKKTILLMTTLAFSLNVSAAMVVIGNPAAGVDTLSQKNVKKLFMGKKTKLPNGDKAKIIELVDGKPELLSTFAYVYEALGIKSNEEQGLRVDSLNI